MIIENVIKKCRKIVCVGRNYADHIKELNNPRPSRPFFFLKPPSSLLAPRQGPVLLPRGIDLHYEVELALIMGRKVLNLAHSHDNDEEAMSAIAGYAVAIDMTARNVQDESKKAGLPWTIAKGFDTFCPISNLIPRAKIPDPHDVKLWLDIDGSRKQNDSTALMLYRIPRLLSDISGVMTLEEGDLVLTGTPKGVGPVQVGQRMTAGAISQGQAVDEGTIDVLVEQRHGGYVH